jgi:hypothetical protein
MTWATRSTQSWSISTGIVVNGLALTDFFAFAGLVAFLVLPSLPMISFNWGISPVASSFDLTSPTVL